jgi:tetratricopeptide (TPR) repeat protein
LGLSAGLVAPLAHAEYNLWVSYHFTGSGAYKAGEYRDALALLNQASPEVASRYRQADTQDQLGRAAAAVGEFDAAETHFSEALALAERSLGRHHRDVARILNNLADLRYLKGEHDAVEDLYRRALEINTRDHLNVEVGRSLNGLALIHNDRGEAVEAEGLLLRAVTVHEKGQRRDDPYLATVLTNLGILYLQQGRHAESAERLERAAYIQGVSLRADHPDVSVRMHAQAALLQATGRKAEAVALAREAEAIRAKQAAKGDLY